MFLWPTLAVASFYFFICYLEPAKKKNVKSSTSEKLHKLLTIAFTFGVTTQLTAVISLRIFSAITYSPLLGYTFSRGEAYYVYIIGFVAGLVIVITRLLSSIVRSRRGAIERRALVAALYTVIFASIFGIIFNILVPVLTSSQSYIGLGLITVDIFAVGFALSIARSHLIDVRLYAVRTVAYMLSVISLALIYIAVVFGVSRIVLGYEDTQTQAINIILTLILAFVFQPIKQFFDRITNRIFYRHSYVTDDFFARLNGILTSTTDLRVLLSRAVEEISSTLNAKHGLFVVYSDKGRFTSVGTRPHSVHMPAEDVRTLEAYVLANNKETIVTNLLDYKTMLRRLLVSHKIELVLPLLRSEKIIGYLFLGEQLKGQYSYRDIKVLETMSDELVIAIQNALSVQEVRELNETLQQRVNEATKELRASNSQLQRLDKAKDEFVGMASHQLRTPLTSVKGYLSMVIEGDAGKITESQKQLLEEAFTSSERMVHLINDFLNVSRLQTGKFLIDKRPINLAKVVEQELDSLVTTAASRNLTFSYKSPKDFPMLDLDEGKMRQVIMNFADNALYYSAEHTNIFVRLAIEGEDVVFAVKDAGIGVPQAEQSQLFSKFYRASNARKQRPDGTGVGLFLAKKVIDAHGGKVIFESVEGQGSTFGFRLPLGKLRSAYDAN